MPHFTPIYRDSFDFTPVLSQPAEDDVVIDSKIVTAENYDIARPSSLSLETHVVRVLTQNDADVSGDGSVFSGELDPALGFANMPESDGDAAGPYRDEIEIESFSIVTPFDV